MKKPKKVKKAPPPENTKRREEESVSWFDTGEGAAERNKKREANIAASRRKGKSWVRLGPGENIDVLVKDKVLAYVVIHSGAKGAGKKKKPWWMSCLGDQGDCPACQEEIYVFTALCAGEVINLTGFKDDEGKRVRFFKQLLVLKSDSKTEWLNQIEALKEARGEKFNVKYTLWNIRRSKDPRSPNCGTHFTFKKKFKNREAVIEYLEEKGAKVKDWDLYLANPEYKDIFKPRTAEQMRSFLGLGNKAVPGDEDDDYEDPDDMEEDDDLDEDEAIDEVVEDDEDEIDLG
jgi:hypothetical protein